MSAGLELQIKRHIQTHPELGLFLVAHKQAGLYFQGVKENRAPYGTVRIWTDSSAWNVQLDLFEKAYGRNLNKSEHHQNLVDLDDILWHVGEVSRTMYSPTMHC